MKKTNKAPRYNPSPVSGKGEVKRHIDGIVLVNKPLGMSSNHVLQRVKRLYSAEKAGHTGSLDPLATGMLPICLGDATKFSQVLLERDKNYVATGLLGVKTTTADAAGEVVAEVSDFCVTKSQLLKVLDRFLGVSLQTPSMYSALKYQGKPLYHYARQGIDVPAKSREIHIHALTLSAFDGMRFSIEVVCGKGTYIRNLVEDIGDALGVGAHVVMLHRVSVGGFETLPMFSIEALDAMTPAERDACLLPPETPLMDLAAVHLDTCDVEQLRQGKILTDPALHFAPDDLLRIYCKTGAFVGVVVVLNDNQIRAKRLMRIPSQG